VINTSLCYIYRWPDAASAGTLAGREILMLHRVRKKNDPNHDKWIGIGGRFEDRESPEDCALREVKEETGLTLTSWRYRGIVTFVSDTAETEYMHLFSADGFRGQLTDCDEGELAWVPQRDFDALPQWEGDRIFLRLMDEEAPFFSLKLEYRGDRLVRAALNGKSLDRADGSG